MRKQTTKIDQELDVRAYIKDTYTQRRQDYKERLQTLRERVPAVKAKIEILTENRTAAEERGDIEELARISAEIDASKAFLSRSSKAIERLSREKLFTPSEAGPLAQKLIDDYLQSDYKAREELAGLTEQMTAVAIRQNKELQEVNGLLHCIGVGPITNDTTIRWGTFLEGQIMPDEEKAALQTAYTKTKQGKHEGLNVPTLPARSRGSMVPWGTYWGTRPAGR